MTKPKLNLPEYSFRFVRDERNELIFDEVRKKFLVLTPEEWVRQNFVKYLNLELGFPISLMVLEMGSKKGKLHRRSDIVIFDKKARSRMIVECKSPKVEISQKVFDQIVRYNDAFRADFLIVTNGFDHYCCQMDYTAKSYEFIDSIPNYESFL